MLSFFPLDILDEIWDSAESVSEGFPTYSYSFYDNSVQRFHDPDLLKQFVAIYAIFSNTSVSSY